MEPDKPANIDTETATTPKPKRRRKRRHMFWRIPLLVVLGLMLAAVILIAAGLPIPVPISLVNAALKAYTKDASVHLSWYAAVIEPKKRTVTITAPRLSYTGKEVIGASTVEVQFGLGWLIGRNSSFLHKITIDKITPLRFHFDSAGRAQLPPNVAFALQHLPKRQAAVTTTGVTFPPSIRIPRIRIIDTPIVMVEDPGGHRPDAIPESIYLNEAEWIPSERGQGALSAEGWVAGVDQNDSTLVERAQRFDLKLNNRPGDALYVWLKWPDFHHSDFRGKAKSSYISGLDVGVRVVRESNTWGIDGKVEAQEIILPLQQDELRDDDIKLEISARISSSTRQLRKLDLTSKNARVSSSFDSVTSAPSCGRIQIMGLGQSYLGLISSVMPAGWGLEIPNDAVLADATWQQRPGDWLPAVQGTAQLSSTTVDSIAWPDVLRDISAKVELSTDVVRLLPVHARFGEHSWIDFMAEVVRSADPAKKGQFTAATIVTIPVRDLLSVVLPLAAPASSARGLVAQPNAVQGNISLEAMLRQPLPPLLPSARPVWREWLAQLADPVLSATLLLDSIQIAPEVLGVPISLARAELNVTERSLKMDPVTVLLDAVPLQLDANLRWDRPNRAALKALPVGQIRVSGRLGQALAAVKAKLPARVAKLNLDADLALIASNTRADNGTNKFRVDVTVRNGRADLPTSPTTTRRDLTCPVRNVAADISFDGQTLAITKLVADVGTQKSQVTASARATPELLELEALVPKGELADVAQAIPIFGGQMDPLSGPFSSDGKLTLRASFVADKSVSTTAPVELQRLTAISRSLAAFPRYWKEGKVAIQSAFLIKNGRLRHISFPPASRTEKRTIPAAEMTNISGRVTLNRALGGNLLLSATDLALRLPGDGRATVSGMLDVRPGTLPKLSLDLKANSNILLDPWVLGWGAAIPSAQKTPGTSGKVFDLDLTVAAPQMTFRGEAGQSVAAHLRYKLTSSPKVPRELIIDTVTLKSSVGKKTGRLEANAALRFTPTYTPGYPSWQIQGKIEPAFPLRILSAWVLDFSRPGRGKVGGTFEVSSRSFQPGDIWGKATVRLEDFSQSDSPILTGLLRFLRIPGRDKLFTSRSEASFKLKSGTLQFENVELTQTGLSLRGRGKLDFAEPGGAAYKIPSLDSRFQVEVIGSVLKQIPIVMRLPIVGTLVSKAGQVGDQIVRMAATEVQVYGNPSEPNVRFLLGSALRNPASAAGDVRDNVMREVKKGADRGADRLKNASEILVKPKSSSSEESPAEAPPEKKKGGIGGTLKRIVGGKSEP